MRRSPTPPHRLTEAEVAGFRAGVAHALAERRRSGTPDLPGEADLEEADRQIARHAWAEAEALLGRAQDRLADAEPEPEVSERPRGLVSFVAPGPPDAPTAPEEDRLRNRILLVTRLASVHDRSGGEVDEARALLRRATEALEAGDRRASSTLVDAAADRLDRSIARRSDRARDDAAFRDR